MKQWRIQKPVNEDGAAEQGDNGPDDVDNPFALPDDDASATVTTSESASSGGALSAWLMLFLVNVLIYRRRSTFTRR